MHVASHGFSNIFPKIAVNLFHSLVTDRVNDVPQDTSTRMVRLHI